MTPKFMVVNGKRKDGRDKYLWGEYKQLKTDGVRGLEEYIKEYCGHPVYTDLLKPRTPKPAPALATEKAVLAKAKRPPCNHGKQVDYIEEQNAAYCGAGYYLHGVKCGDGCGATFVQSKALELQEGSRGVQPSGSAPVYCCTNILGKNTSAGDDGACRHAVCSDCWKKRILAQSNDAPGGRRSSSRK